MAQLLLGLVLYGASLAMLVRAGLGLAPWDVLHQGLARRLELSLGTVVIVVSAVVLLGWLPLRQRPGIGTVANAVLVGVVVDRVLAVLPDASGYPARYGLLVAGVLSNALATALYIGAGLGPGARDGLMTGIAGRGYPLRVVRTCIELSVLAVGWLLGGTVGIGTLVYALAIGPLVHRLLPVLTRPGRPATHQPPSASPRSLPCLVSGSSSPAPGPAGSAATSPRGSSSTRVDSASSRSS